MANPPDSSVYYQLTYWNDYEEVVRHLNQRAFDDPDGTWWDFVAQYFGSPKRMGLSFNCGTGWVERDLLDAGAVEHIVAVDYLQDLLDAGAAVSAPYSIEYHRLDTNAAEFPVRDYDLVINHAAGHHVAHLDRVYRRLWELLGQDGHLVMYDYTGPHRNQYGDRIWNAATACNATLPPEFRSEMNYPHFATMMASDPTEAIHSELVLETTARYFRFDHVRRLGGPIAYLLLTHNQALQAAPPEVRADLVERVLAADVEHIGRFPQDSLFTFAICSPRAADEFDQAQLDTWAFAEADREAAAMERSGRYYLASALEPPAEVPRDEVVVDAAPPEMTPYSVAVKGPRFVLAALVRSVAIRLPATLPLLRLARRAVRRCRRLGQSGSDPT